jgi:hypothetical protein
MVGLIVGMELLLDGMEEVYQIRGEGEGIVSLVNACNKFQV